MPSMAWLVTLALWDEWWFRAEFWEVILALRAADGIHLGVVNLGVVRHVDRLLDGNEFWGVILALQANDGVHLGVDNLGVVRQVGRLLDGKGFSSC